MSDPLGRPQMHNVNRSMEKNIDELTQALIAMSPTVSPYEAREIAEDAYVYPQVLANKWGLTWPPLWHNTLRNSGSKPAGLCTDWTKAMIDQMRSKKLFTVDIYWAVAFKGNPWREHSTMVITPKNAAMEDGIILDPWRNSAQLFWLDIKKDYKYPWKYYAGPFKYHPKQYLDFIPDDALIVD